MIAVALPLAASCAGGKPPTHAKLDLKEKDDAYLQFIRADLMAIGGDTRKSTAELMKLTQRYPDMAYFHYLLAENFGREKRFDLAAESAKRALELDPQFSEARIYMGRLYSLQERHADAAREFAIVARQDPRREEVYPLLAGEYVSEREYGRAIEVLKGLLSVNPDSVIAYYYLGVIYDQNLRNPNQALKMYQEALSIDPGSVSVHNAMAELYLRKHELRKALTKYMEISHLEPDDIAVMLRVALIHYELKEYPAAIEVFEKILARNPEADKIRFYLGVLYESAKQNDKAIAELMQVPPKSSYFKDSRIHVASLHRQEGRPDEAAEVLKGAIRQKPQVPEFYEYLAAVYEENDRVPEAIAILEEGHRAVPDEEKIVFLLGIVYEKALERERAVWAMKEVLRINPQNASALNYIGYTWADGGENLEEALEMIQQALVLRPGDGFITDSLGWAYFRMGDTERALKYLMKANSLVPGEPTILDHIGEVMLARGDVRAALKYFEQAFEAGRRKKSPDEREQERLKEKIDKLKGGQGL